jgi:hypothetical protein
MKTGRGKAVAIAAAVLGLAVLAATGFAFKDRIIAEWRLWDSEPKSRSQGDHLEGVDYIPQVPRG